MPARGHRLARRIARALPSAVPQSTGAALQASMAHSLADSDDQSGPHVDPDNSSAIPTDGRAVDGAQAAVDAFADSREATDMAPID